MQDLRLAIRALRATPIVTAVAVLSLALGIGANTAIFSLANSLLLRSLPVTEPQRLARLSMPPPVPGMVPGFSYATFREIRRYGRDLFDGVLGYQCCGSAVVTLNGQNQELQRSFVTDDFFTTLGIHAFRGRLLRPGDDDPGTPDGPVAVLSYRAWTGPFGGRDDVIGSRPAIDGMPITIIGVTPPQFSGLQVGLAIDVSIPEQWAAKLTRTPFDEDTAWLNVIARVRPGISLPTATTGLRDLQPQIRTGSFPKKPPVSSRWLADALTLEPAGTGMSTIREWFTTPLIVLFVIVLLVLLVACANIASLLLAREVARRHELSVRLALGASSWRLARQLLVESLILAATGAAFALGLAVWASRATVAYLSTTKEPIVLDVSVDGHVLAMTGAATLLTAVLFGLAPAVRASRVAPMDALKAQNRGGAPTDATSSGILAVQVALCVVLVFTAGLCVRTFERLGHVSLGFDRDHVLVILVNAHAIPFAARLTQWQRFVDAASTVPGVLAAGGSLNPPIAGTLHDISANFVVSEPGVRPGPDAELIRGFDSVTPGFFSALDSRILLGRDIDARDTATSPLVMVVNQTFTRQFFRGANPIGHVLTLTYRLHNGDYRWGDRTIVGVVTDSVEESLRDRPPSMIYVPLAQRTDGVPQSDFYIALRTAGGLPRTLTRNAVDALTAVNRDVTFTMAPLAQYVDESLAMEHLTAIVSAFFGGLALLLAGLGFYGITAYAVARRRKEIGIRMALGASPTTVVRLVLSRVTMLVGLGILIGIGVSVWASRFVAALLYGVTPRDPVILASAIMVLASVAALAGWIPAWRASRIDPAVVLRNE